MRAVTLHRTEPELRACHILQDRTDNEQIVQGKVPKTCLKGFWLQTFLTGVFYTKIVCRR